MNDLINITNRDGQAVVSSLEVAERFGKQHKHVLESIKGTRVSQRRSCRICSEEIDPVPPGLLHGGVEGE